MPALPSPTTPNGDGFVRTTPEHRAARLARVREAMGREGLDALVVAGRGVISQYGYVEYLTGYCPVVREAYAVLVGEQEPALILPTAADVWYASRASGLSDIRLAGQGDVLSSYDSLPGAVIAALIERGVEDARIGVVGLQHIVAHGHYEQMRDALGKAELVDATALLAGVKALKDEVDLHELRRTAAIAQQGLRVGLSGLRAGAIPREVGGAMEGAVRAQGAREVLIFLSAHPYFLARPDALAFADGDLVTAYVEMAGPSGYWVECGALVAIGQLDGDRQALAEACLGAAAEAQQNLRPGRTAGDVADAIDRAAERAGLRVGIWHGHGVGVDHDPPVITADDRTPLQPNMVISVHPNFSTADERLGASVACTSILGEAQADALTDIQLSLHRA